MKKLLIAGVLAGGFLLLRAPAPAEAAGCLSGAAVGGVAGHMVGSGHAGLGAAAGCAVGHHEANKQAAQRQAVTSNNGGGNSGTTTTQGQPNNSTTR